MRTLLALASLVLLMVGGCVRVTAETSAPLYDPKTGPKLDPRLLGVWLPDTQCIKLQWGDGNSYLVDHGGLGWLVVFGDLANRQSGTDALHLVRVGKYDYFFAAPKAGETGTSLTGCCRVEFADDRITLRGLNLQTVATDLLDHPDRLKHEWTPATTQPATTQSPTTTQPQGPPQTRAATEPATTEPASPLNGDLKITDDPPAVRAYLIQHQEDAAFFNEPVVLYRIAK